MLTVLAQSDQTKFWATKAGFYHTDDVHQWQQQKIMVSLIEVVDFDAGMFKKVRSLVDMSDLALLFFPEFITDEWCHEFDLPDVVQFLGGKLHWQPQHCQLADCLYFFWSTCDFYAQFPQLAHIPDTNDKHKYFDVLLGRKKPHRDLLYQMVDHDQNIVRYFPNDQDQDLRTLSAEEFQWPSHALDLPDHPINYTVQEVVVDGVIVSLSQIIPVDIYSQSLYTLVAETETSNTFSFFTEKIVKPILAKRMFLVSAGQHYLRALRQLGFLTFSDIIDESYDEEPNLIKRNHAIVTQMKYLQCMEPGYVKSRIQPVLDHNYHVMTKSCWQQNMVDTINSVIRSRYINKNSKEI